MATLRDFLTEGKLGPVALGVQLAAVRDALGEPQDATPKGRKPMIWTYGTLQVAFLDALVTCIGIYPRRGHGLPSALHLDGYVPRGRTSLKQFEAYVRAEDIRFTPDTRLTFDDQVGFSVGIGVDAVFDGSSLWLDSLQLTRRAAR